MKSWVTPFSPAMIGARMADLAQVDLGLDFSSQPHRPAFDAGPPVGRADRPGVPGSRMPSAMIGLRQARRRWRTWRRRWPAAAG